MLEFSDAPYRFYEPKPSPVLIRLAGSLNRHFLLPGRNHRIDELRVEGDSEATRELLKKGERAVFVINHPTHSDPHVVTEIQRRCGVSLESSLGIESTSTPSTLERVRRIRSRIHQIRLDETEAGEHLEIGGIAERAILALRIHGYLTPYLTEHPSIDRYDETVERIAEDFYSRAMPRTGPRRVIARIQSPVLMSDCLEEAGGRLRMAVAPLTAHLEQCVQSGIDAINESNDAPGASLVVSS